MSGDRTQQGGSESVDPVFFDPDTEGFPLSLDRPVEEAAAPAGPERRGWSVGLVVAGLLVAAGFWWLLGRPAEVERDERTVPVEAEEGLADEDETPEARIMVRPAQPPPLVDSGDQPGRSLLGGITGLTLFIGGEAPLQAIDLDSGQQTTYGIRAHPVLATGPSLILYQPQSDLVGWVELTDPGQQVSAWKGGKVATGVGAGQVWILDREASGEHPAGVPVGSGEWELINTVDDRVQSRLPGDRYDEVEAPTPPDDSLGGIFEAIEPGPYLSTRPDGVYRFEPEGYERLAGGRLLLVDARFARALVGNCGPDGPCELQWINSFTGTPLDLPLPSNRPRAVTLLGGERWVLSVGWDGSSELIELKTDRRITSLEQSGWPAISPDGRWLAQVTGTEVTISSLITSTGEPRVMAVIGLPDGEGENNSLVLARTPIR